MKKISLFSLALLTPLLTFGLSPVSNDVMCVQMTQPAINAQGQCQEFATPCEVPDDWKKVSSCEDFAEKRSTRIDAVTKRRHQAKWNALRAKAAKNFTKKTTARTHKFLRKSRKFVRNNKDRVLKKYDKIRGTSEKKWDSKYRNQVSPARQKMLDEKAKIQEIKKQARSANELRKRTGSATEVVRTGKLSNKFWSTAKKSREKRMERFGKDSDTLRKALRSRQPFRKAKKKRKHTPKRAKIRRTYKGESIRGSLSN